MSLDENIALGIVEEAMESITEKHCALVKTKNHTLFILLFFFFKFVYLGHTSWYMKPYFSDQGSNPQPKSGSKQFSPLDWQEVLIHLVHLYVSTS